MVVHLVCQCGFDLAVPETMSGTDVCCPRCGRPFSAAAGFPADETGLFARAPSSEFEGTPPLRETPPESTQAEDDVTRISVRHSSNTRIKPPTKDENASAGSKGSGLGREGSGATRIFDAERRFDGGEDHEFELADPARPAPDASPPEDEETKFSSRPNREPEVGSSSQAESSVGHSSGSRISELDLMQRVMGTISHSSAPLNMPADSGGYGFHRVLRTHQKGGMGRILIAYDQFLKRDIALKELHPEVAEDISIVRRFIGEAEITAQLEHPGIVPIHTLALDRNGSPYYTMKLIRGHTLQEAIKAYHRQPTRTELLNLIRRLVSICKTIAFAHNKGVIHRDLKPANIMLGEHGETLVMDWGLAKPIGQVSTEDTTYASIAVDHRSTEPRPELTMVGAIVGTPAFMSPEQASPEEHEVGPLSDVFSLGTILYYLLAGQTAFSGRSTQEVLSKVRAASPPKPSEIKSNVPPGLEAICARAMAKEPENRYQSATEMVDDLCRWLDGEPVRAQKETFFQSVHRWVDRHRLLAVSVPFAIILFILLMNMAVYFDRRGRDRYHEDAVRAVLSVPVDLTDQREVLFRGSPGVEVRREHRLTGGEMISCQIEMVGTGSGAVEMVAPAHHTWDLTGRKELQLSIFETFDLKEDRSAPLADFFIRMGRGSSYFEYRPEPEWWANRRLNNWHTFSVPLAGSPAWLCSEFGSPLMSRIEWVEFHFKSHSTGNFKMDNVMFLNRAP